MATTMSADRGPTEVRTSDPQSTLPLIGAAKGPIAVDLPDGEWILPLIERAIDRSMSRKEAAILMQQDLSLLKRQLKGDGHLSVKRLGALGESFWSALKDEISNYFGLLDKAELIAQGEALLDRGRQLLAKAAQR